MVRSEYIPNHPNYLITEDGEVINIKRRRVMQPGDNGHRSIHVYLRGDVPNGGKSYQVRKLVADAFLPEKPGPEYVLTHINGDYTDCSAKNLKWDTRRNIQVKALLTMQGHDIHQPIRIVGTDVVYKNIFECADDIDGNPRLIHRTTLNSNWEYRGMRFEYV